MNTLLLLANLGLSLYIAWKAGYIKKNPFDDARRSE